MGTFCTADNQCDMNQIHYPSQYPTDPGSHCLRDDLKCWWHQPVSWVDCAASCGYEELSYQPGSPEPSPVGEKLYGPDCGSAPPDNSLIVLNTSSGDKTEAAMACGTRPNSGTMSWVFNADSSGNYPSKIDFHQLDTGFGDHYWYAHTWNRSVTANAIHKITGTWTLNQGLLAPGSWARVLVYIPDHGMMTPQAVYTVNGSDSTSPTRSIVGGNYLDDTRKPAAGHWESLGAFHFTGTPSVSLDNLTHLPLNDLWTDGERSVSWDAVAFQSLPGKPINQVVALGDSYSSGEGASNAPVNGAWDYYRSSDHDGTNNNGDHAAYQDACHRSPNAWSRVAILPDLSGVPIGARADNNDPSLDYHMSACAGAYTHDMLASDPNANVYHTGEYHEGSQLDQGYLDDNTTLVTFSIGGNDARFVDIVKQCLYGSGFANCQDSTLAGDTAPLSQAEPDRINRLRPDITTVLQQVHTKAPNAQILLVGYPQLFSGAPCLVNGLTIGATDVQWLNQMSATLNAAMNQAINDIPLTDRLKMTFVDPQNTFTNHGLCEPTGNTVEIHDIVLTHTRGESPLTLTRPASVQSLHPTVDGAARYGRLVTTCLSGGSCS